MGTSRRRHHPSKLLLITEFGLLSIVFLGYHQILVSIVILFYLYFILFHLYCIWLFSQWSNFYCVAMSVIVCIQRMLVDLLKLSFFCATYRVFKVVVIKVFSILFRIDFDDFFFWMVYFWLTKNRQGQRLILLPQLFIDLIIFFLINKLGGLIILKDFFMDILIIGIYRIFIYWWVFLLDMFWNIVNLWIIFMV